MARGAMPQLPSERLQVRRDVLAVVFGRDASDGFGEHHLEQIDDGSEVIRRLLDEECTSSHAGLFRGTIALLIRQSRRPRRCRQ